MSNYPTPATLGHSKAADHAADLSRFLKRLTRHSRLAPEEIDAVTSLKFRTAPVGPHRDIVSPGQTVNEACYVAAGLVGRFDQMLDGSRQITAIHIPGDMCDLHSVVLPTASWSLTALTRSITLRIPHEDLRALALERPNVAIAFWRDTALDAAVIGKWYGNLGSKNAQARFAHLFCEMGMRMEFAGLAERTGYPFPIVQSDLADATGLTAVHVNRTLQAMRETGVVEFRDRRVTIPDWAALAKLAEFDDSYLLSVPH